MEPHTTPEPNKPPSPKVSKAASIKLSEAFKKYGKVRLEGKLGREVDKVAFSEKGEAFERNSLPNLRSTAKLLVDVIGDKDVSELKKSDFTEVFSVIQRAPANHGKSSTETRSTREIIAAIDLKEQKNKARVEPLRFFRRLFSSYFKLRFDLTSSLVRIVPPLRLA